MSGTAFFDDLQKSFTDVPIDSANNNAIDTIAFLDASETMVKMFDALNSTILSNTVKPDMTNNIKGVREGCIRNPLHAATLQALIAVDAKAQEKLMWLVRGLRFIYFALTTDLAGEGTEVDAKTQAVKTQKVETLSEAFKFSYNKVLAPCHGKLVAIGIRQSLAFVPNASDFYPKLSSTLTIDEIKEKLTLWLGGLGRIVDILYPLIDDKSEEYKARLKK
ncbi:hypothetical protein SEUCBS139899_002759 [Sporothrix eucalyptigena]|uniref:Glycolipid transfer protein domain-containing protein n=1 Tax=Sporothrix eucalyptigena TaxID=1812306 RepID=A0ABP0CRN0_9PEZI